MSAPAATGSRAARGEEVLGKAYDIGLMRRLWRFVRPHWRILLVSFALIPTTIAFELVQPYLIKLAFERHIAVGVLAGLSTICLLYVGFVALQGLSSYGEQYALNLLGQRSMHGLRLAIYDHVLRQRAAFFDRMPVGRLMTRMTNDIESINEMFASGVITLVADVIKMVVIVVIMLSLDVTLTLVTFMTVPLLMVVVNWARHAMRTSFREIRIRIAAMNAYLSEHLGGIAVVQLFGREQGARAEYDEINAAHRDAYLLSIRADAAMYALVEAIGVIAVGCVAWWTARSMGASTDAVTTVALVIVFIEYINKFFIPVRDLSAKYAVMQGAMAATERIMELLATDEPDAPPRPEPVESVAVERARVEAAGDGAPFRAAAAPSAPPLVSFRNVHFAYGRGEPVLQGVDLDVPRGATVAVVGATGSGKSTLMKLLTRLYDPVEGGILIGGRDVRDLPVAELRRRVTVVSQDVFLFAGTVADNVRMGFVDAAGAHGGNGGNGHGSDGTDRATRERIEAMLARVGADRMLARRGSDGIDAVIAERGANFSAGERQLIAFARALARDPEILVLDEATAHVDPEAEAWIERGVAELMRGRTTLVIAHRLSTIRNADEIAVMARGHLVERGSHDQLLASGGMYAALERTFRRKD